MRIPMKGSVGSLNAAVAGSILLFEALAQREPATVASESSEAEATTPPKVSRRRATKPSPETEEPRPKDDELLPADAAPKRPRRPRRPVDAPD
jgi:hypothetical protein